MEKKRFIKVCHDHYLISPFSLFLHIFKRTLHSKSDCKDNLITPLVVYNNIEVEKASILKDNKGKIGIYR